MIVSTVGTGADELLRYQRDAIIAGEWWRLFSGHLVHLSLSHMWLNLAGLLLVWALVGKAFSLRTWWWLTGSCLLGISLGLLWWLPELAWYVGLSGVLHGMLFAGSLRLALRGEREALLLVVIVIAKVSWELWQGPLPGSRKAAGGEVVVQAHALGCLSGAIYVALLRVLGRCRPVRA
jgi:rhomboid family GlyGly-CTERM serine protease